MCIYSLDNGAGDWVRNRAAERESRTLTKFKGTECRLESDKTCKMITSSWQLSKEGKRQVQRITDLNL